MDRCVCVLAVCVLASACRISVPEGVLPCASQRDCPVTWACSQGTCVQALQAPERDAGVRAVLLYDASSVAPTVRDASVHAVVHDASMPPRVAAAADSGARVTASSMPAQHEDAEDAGTSAVDAATEHECHADYVEVGAQCGGSCDTPGVIRCDGSCSKPDPDDLGDECGHCGGHIQCDGSCDFPDPPRCGELCVDLLSSVGCSGGCECVRQCPNGQLVPCARLCPILCGDGFCDLP